jgi:hypothetical protein
MKILLKYLLMILLLASCEKQTDWPLQPGEQDFIVVDGIITNELKTQTIIISKPVANLNEHPQPVSGAIILVSSNQSVYSFHEDPSIPGTYLSDNEFSGIRNKTYSLLITSGSNVYSAKAVLAPPAVIRNFLRYQKNGNENKYHITWVADPYNSEKAAMYEILIDWSKVTGYETINPDSCKAKLFYYTLPTLDVSEVFAPGSEKITFPPGAVITERKYSLTDEHAAFLRALLLETTWQGGFFNTAAANVPTNLSDGAEGFFGACGITEMKEIAK